MTDPTLSVTVGNRNYARYLPRNVESILSQSFEDFELILIDNASTDDSVEVMQHYASMDKRIRVVAHASDIGMFGSMREACELSRGRYRVPVDADDWVFDPHAFRSQVEMLDAHPAMAFTFSALSMVDSDGNEIYTSHAFPADVVLPGEQALEAILSFTLTHSGMMIRLDSYRRTAGYPTSGPHVPDMVLAARLCEVGDVGYLDRRLYAFRQHDTNLHNRPELAVVRNEIFPVIAAAFDGPLGSRIPDADAARRRVEQRALVHLPTQYIFSGQPRTGWRLYLESLKLRPIDTVFQRRTVSLLARTLLGAHNFARLEARMNRSTPPPHPIDTESTHLSGSS